MYLEAPLLLISSLLDEPGVTDPLVPEIAALYLSDRAAYDEVARSYTCKFATGTRPRLTTRTQAVVDPVSRLLDTVRKRLNHIREEAAEIIQALHGQVLQSASRKSDCDELQPQSLLETMYQLSSGLTELSQRLESGEETQVPRTEPVDDLEGDLGTSGDLDHLCLLSSGLLYDIRSETAIAWKQPPPQLLAVMEPVRDNFAPEAIYGCKWIWQKEYRRFGIRPVQISLLEKLHILVKHCQWINGDGSEALTSLPGIQRQAMAAS